jgi:hypothetical protein
MLHLETLQCPCCFTKASRGVKVTFILCLADSPLTGEPGYPVNRKLSGSQEVILDATINRKLPTAQNPILDVQTEVALISLGHYRNDMGKGKVFLCLSN